MRTTTRHGRQGVPERGFAAVLFTAVALAVVASATGTLLAAVPAPVLGTLVVIASWYVGMAVALLVPFAVLRLVTAVAARR